VAAAPVIRATVTRIAYQGPSAPAANLAHLSEQVEVLEIARGEGLVLAALRLHVVEEVTLDDV
jgi:hypothetical protein